MSLLPYDLHKCHEFQSFKLLDQLENLTPVWKFVEAELPSEPCLNNLERLRFVICLYTKDLLLHRPRHH